MAAMIMWALLTGGITGGVWVSIVLLGNHARLRREQQVLGVGIEQRREELARLESRLAFVESRFSGLDGVIAGDLARFTDPAKSDSD